MGSGQTGEVGREKDGGRVGEQHLLLELVRLGGARARLEHGPAAEEEVLDRTLGHGVSASTTGRRSTPISLRALAGGIGAVRARPPSRSRSIFPSVFASASRPRARDRRGRR